MATSKKATKPSVKKHTKASLRRFIPGPIRRLAMLRATRAHKSFKLTRRRDIPKRAKLPGYISFTKSVGMTLWKFRRTFMVLLAVYVVLAFILIGLSQQEEYRTLTDALGDAGKDTSLDAVTQVAGLFGATLVGTLNGSLSEIQQYYLVGVYVWMWLVIVWLLRQLLAGNRVRTRDGIYSAGSPLVSSMMVLSLMFIQAIPGAIGVLLFALATQSGAASGVIGMMFGIAALLLMVLSLYWLTSSFFALIIVTLPGTYPLTAIRGASEIALGRRTQLLFRLLWLVIVLLLIWVIILVPAVLVDFWVKVSWLPLVAIAVQIATGMSLIFGASYVYLLYREMIDEHQ